MKIEVDLMKINDEIGVKMARVSAVALLSALPQDEAEFAVQEWRAVLVARSPDASQPSETPVEAASVKADEYYTVPPHDAGYSAAPPIKADACEACGSQVSRPGNILCDACMAKAQPAPKYKVGDWVMTPVAEHAGRIVGMISKGLQDKGGARICKVEVDDGDAQPTIYEVDARQVRLATPDEVAAVTGQEPAPAKRKGGRKKVEPIDAPAEAVAEPEQVIKPAGNGSVVSEEIELQDAINKAQKYHGESLRELCKLAEHHAGRDKMFEVFRALKVTDIKTLTQDKANEVRAAVLELVP